MPGFDQAGGLPTSGDRRPPLLGAYSNDRPIVRWSIGNAFGLEFVGMSFDEKQRLEGLILVIQAAQPSGLKPPL